MKKLLLSIMVTVLASVCCSGSSDAGGEGNEAKMPATLILAGSGSNLPITRILAEAFMQAHPEINIEIPPSIGTRGAIQAIVDGAIGIGLISRPLAREERKTGLTILPYARTGVVIGVNPTVEEEEISFVDLVNIYRGKKARWKDGHEIIVLTREPGDSSIDVLRREVPGFEEAYDESLKARRWTVLFTDQRMNQAIEDIPYAMGISDMGSIASEHLNIKILKLNGQLPTVNSLFNGGYPLLKDLSFVYMDRKLPEGAEEFLNYVKSKEGAELLRAYGYLDLN